MTIWMIVVIVVLLGLGCLLMFMGFDSNEFTLFFIGVSVALLAVVGAVIGCKTSSPSAESITCPVCRVEVDTAFCGQCGWKAKPQAVYCPTCDILIEDKYCTSCGVAREEAQQRNAENLERKMQKTLDNQE